MVHALFSGQCSPCCQPASGQRYLSHRIGKQVGSQCSCERLQERVDDGQAVIDDLVVLHVF